MFKVGERVRVTSGCPYWEFKGLRGTVVRIYHNDPHNPGQMPGQVCCIQFDEGSDTVFEVGDIHHTWVENIENGIQRALKCLK